MVHGIVAQAFCPEAFVKMCIVIAGCNKATYIFL